MASAGAPRRLCLSCVFKLLGKQLGREGARGCAPLSQPREETARGLYAGRFPKSNPRAATAGGRRPTASSLEDDVADLLHEPAEARAFEVRHDDDGEPLVGLHVEEGADALLPARVADGALARRAL